MSEYIIESQTLTDIADAIRGKTGSSSTLTPLEMPNAIANIPSGSSINTTTIEIGENSVTNAGQLYNYFKPYFRGAIALLSIELVEDTYTVNNQFVKYRYGESTSYNASSYRWRGGSVGSFPWTSGTYDTKIVAGTHYTITWIPAGS